jgi:hypothetical protein
MPFSHSVYPFSKEDYLAEVGKVLNDANTLVFLDTNVLGYLFKLLGAARNEFFTWTDRLIIEERLKIPAWVLSEYLAKLKNKKLGEYTAQSSEPDEIRKKLENLHRMASLFVDEQVLKGIGFTGDRQKYLADFEAAIKALTPFTGAFKRQFDAATIHSEIAARLSPAVLASNIGELCARAGREGDVRQSHRMPPGYKDAGKDENKYGDLIIWFEILEFAQEHKDRFQKTVILTNDAKADWVYAPEHRMEKIKGVAKALPNKVPQINLPDPRLVAEFQAVVGHRDLYIVSLPIFVEALVKISGAGLHNLASAIQVEVETREEADRESGASSHANGEPSCEEAAQPKTVEPAADAPQAPSVSQLHTKPVQAQPPIAEPIYPADALRDGAYELKEGSPIDELIRELKSHNWYAQNPAITKIKALRHQPFAAGEWFVLGRNIYQAACGSALKAVEFMRNLDIELGRHDLEAANHLLAGMLFEVYFDSEGQLRRHPKADQIDSPFREAGKPNFEMASAFIQAQLHPYRDQLLIAPGDATIIELKVDATLVQAEGDEKMHYRLVTVLLGDVSLLETVETAETNGANINRWLADDDWTLDKLKSTLSESWAIPEWQIVIKQTPAELGNRDVLCVPEGMRLITANRLRQAQH